MDLVGICTICGKPGGIHTCMLCGRLVCSRCFDTQHNICTNCSISRPK